MSKSSFLIRLQEFIEHHSLFNKADRLLLAVSGGVDSVVLAHTLHQLGYDIGIAHCNFQLRGQESELDELFVGDLASKLNVSFFCQKFDTSTLSQQYKESIQITARKLRYAWFRNVLAAEGFQYLLTAHHQSDNTETILLNLVRGTGMAGLHGILPKREAVLRPLLFATREQIEEYASQNLLTWREDSSNASTKYARNLIRLKAIPLLKQLNPELDRAFIQTAHYVQQAELLLSKLLKEKAQKVCTLNQYGQCCINIALTVQDESPHLVLHHILQPFGYEHDLIDQILGNTNGTSGKLFYSATHRLLQDRTHWIVDDKTPPAIASKKIDAVDTTIELGGGLTIATEITQNTTVTPNALHLDFNKLSFPITVRPWEKGDFLQPLGMSGSKKVSDFMVDKKLNLFEKEKTLLVESGGNIAGILPHRPSQLFAIDATTQKIFKLTLIAS